MTRSRSPAAAATTPCATAPPARPPRSLALDNGGAVYPHVTTVTVNSTRYTLRKYVTVPTDSTGASYKRITVFAKWYGRGVTHTRSLQFVRRPQPQRAPAPRLQVHVEHQWHPCASPGAALVYGFTLKNNGARDSFALSSSSSGTLIWNYYLDDGGASPGTFGADDSWFRALPGYRPWGRSTPTGPPTSGLCPTFLGEPRPEPSA